MASSSSCSSCSSVKASKIHELVERCCPHLRTSVEHWLRIYRDPQLLFDSLQREYDQSLEEVPDDSDEEVIKVMEGWAGKEDEGRMREKPRRYKGKLCEANLLGKCHRGELCQYAHSDEEQNQWKRRRFEQAPRPRHVEAPDTLYVLPTNIRFCHDTVAPDFQDGRSILQGLWGLMEGEIQLRDLPEMQVVFFEDRLHSLSNRRLCLYILCEHLGLIDRKVPVKVKLLEKPPVNFWKKYTTTCDGDWIRVRRDGRIVSHNKEQTTYGLELLG
ncbi:Hypothetical protein (Fragment) [Durusdinium trenchii]|uniref:C3H1-type domain-containing protein n=1 Tax=Durusdinium trenchii TaxID=1381693 RepID=A0ABP0J2K3_9DINO